jgi:hypothetical protein
MTKIVRAGTALKALIDGRIRHVIVQTVTDQNNISVRLGTNESDNPTIVNADRTASTKTRGTLFVEE